MSADVIQFIPRPRHDQEQTDCPTIAFRCVVREPAADRIDLAPPECVAPDHDEMW